jgi:hypothetical protein
MQRAEKRPENDSSHPDCDRGAAEGVAAEWRCCWGDAGGTKCAVPRSARSIRALARDVATLRADIERYRAQLRDALELVSLLPNDPADRRGAHSHRGSSG